jgi:hypothetical protein
MRARRGLKEGGTRNWRGGFGNFARFGLDVEEGVDMEVEADLDSGETDEGKSSRS